MVEIDDLLIYDPHESAAVVRSVCVQARCLQVVKLMQWDLELDLLLVLLGVAEFLHAVDEAVFFVPLCDAFQHPVLVLIVFILALSNVRHGRIQSQGALPAHRIALRSHRARQGV